MSELSKNTKILTNERPGSLEVVDLIVEGENNWHFKGYIVACVVDTKAFVAGNENIRAIYLYRTQGDAYVCWQASSVTTKAAIIETTEDLISFIGMTALAKELYQKLSNNNPHLAPYLLSSYKKVIF